MIVKVNDNPKHIPESYQELTYKQGKEISGKSMTEVVEYFLDIPVRTIEQPDIFNRILEVLSYLKERPQAQQVLPAYYINHTHISLDDLTGACVGQYFDMLETYKEDQTVEFIAIALAPYFNQGKYDYDVAEKMIPVIENLPMQTITDMYAFFFTILRNWSNGITAIPKKSNLLMMKLKQVSLTFQSMGFSLLSTRSAAILIWDGIRLSMKSLSMKLINLCKSKTTVHLSTVN